MLGLLCKAAKEVVVWSLPDCRMQEGLRWQLQQLPCKLSTLAKTAASDTLPFAMIFTAGL